ncbi:hypothetical protein F2Q70_00011565 [Brassica cretica]|uniref:Uncharacterized protein n=1 Tax=Brassica cretica TaxID=69181 RepID=A0A8S9LX29_BRACR|nr:hypothetical protein F2Q70_00011565 [Brassica cretica]
MAYGYPENSFSEVIHLILSSSSLQMLGIGNLFLPLSQDGFLNAFSLATSMLGNRTRAACLVLLAIWRTLLVPAYGERGSSQPAHRMASVVCPDPILNVSAMRPRSYTL